MENKLLPVAAHLPEILNTISSAPLSIIEAAPGTGKSTVIPLELLKTNPTNKVLLLEPRRVAAKSLALYLSKQMGEPVGGSIGYRMRGDSKVSTSTRMEVITEGLLVRMLIDNPELTGVTHILFDEFHERSLQTDESLALSLNSQKLFRADLKLVIMSATLESGKLKEKFPDALWVSVPGISFPIETNYLGKPERLEEGVTKAILRSLKRIKGDILVFLPGRGEIERVKAKLVNEVIEADVLTLTSETDSRDVFSLFEEHHKNRVILSTSIAETSITLPYVVAVIDSGLSRFPIYNSNTGLSELVTRRASKAVADQRRGRAGRVREGLCYRLWKEGEELLPAPEPEILREDITSFALNVFAFGINKLDELELLDYPSQGRWEASASLLKNLNAIDEKRVVTAHGRQILKIGAHPRLSHMLLKGQENGYAQSAAYSCAVLESSHQARQTLEDAVLKIKKGDSILKRVAERYHRLCGGEVDKSAPEYWYLLASAYPERFARRSERGTYLLASGGEFKLDGENSEFICAGKVERHKGLGRIDLYEKVTLNQLKKHFTVEQLNQIEFDGEKLKAFAVERIGGLILSQKQIAPSKEERQQAIGVWLKSGGLAQLLVGSSARELVDRVRWGAAHGVESKLEIKELSNNLEAWFFPFLGDASNLSELFKIDIKTALLGQLSYRDQKAIEENIPEHLFLETGTKAKIDYREDGSAYVSIILQELLGRKATPLICGVPLTIEVLSPRKLSIQVTSDLGSFWNKVYPDLKGQLKRDYPRHYWPDDPVNSKPVLKGLLRNNKNF